MVQNRVALLRLRQLLAQQTLAVVAVVEHHLGQSIRPQVQPEALVLSLFAIGGFKRNGTLRTAR